MTDLPMPPSPGSPQARELFQRAVANIRAAHFFDALACLDALLGLDPHHADALACRGWIHALHRQTRLARTDLEAALRHAPSGWPRRAEVMAQLAIEDDEIGHHHDDERAAPPASHSIPLIA